MKYTKRIIGRGLLAKSFESIAFDKDVLILASGVSNSQETRVSEFSRELDLINSEISLNAASTVIYFSTCSLCFEKVTPYTIHKLNVEKILAEKCNEYHVFRLPQVVGFVNNTTLISYFVGSIVNGLEVSLQSRSSRDLIDVDDVARIVGFLVNNEKGLNSVVNIAAGNSIPVYDIFTYISNFTGLEGRYYLSDNGDNQKINSDFLKKAISTDVIFKDDYWKYVLNKYLPLYLDQ